MHRLEWHTWNPVLCLTIINHPLNQGIDDKTGVLLWVRTLIQKTHVWVLSSFTQRVPSYALGLIDNEIDTPLLTFNLWDECSWILTNIQFYLESLLCRKLGFHGWNDSVFDDRRYVGNMLWQKTEIKFGNIETGIPKGSDPNNPREHITMYNLLCHIEWFNPPKQTRSYADIDWRRAGDFVNNRLPGTEICEWLCISTSKKALVIAGDFSE